EDIGSGPSGVTAGENPPPPLARVLLAARLAFRRGLNRGKKPGLRSEGGSPRVSAGFRGELLRGGRARSSGGGAAQGAGWGGGSGDQGLGLALRFAVAGREVRIGSRNEERARQAADQVRAQVPGAAVLGLENAEAARQAADGIVILSVPFEHTVNTLKGLQPA